MANVRWKDKADIATLAATDRIPVTDDVAGAATDKYTTPAEIKTYVETGTFTPGGTVDCAGNSVTGTAFDINGGTIDAVTIGTNSACTELQVDNININGNTISSTDADGKIILDTNGTGDINLTTAGGFVVFTEGDIKIGATALTATATELNILDAGSAMNIHSTGSNLIFDIDSVSQIILQDGKLIPITDDDIDLGDATHEFKDIYSDGIIYSDAISNSGTVTTASISCNGTSTLGAIDASGSILLSGAYFAFDGSVQTLTGAGAIDAGEYLVTRLSLTATSNALTIADGDYEGQIKIIRVVAEISGADTGVLAGANFQGTSLTFTDTGSGAILIWDEALGEWYCIANNHCVYAE